MGGDDKAMHRLVVFLAQHHVFHVHAHKASVAAQLLDMVTAMGVATIGLQHQLSAAFGRGFAREDEVTARAQDAVGIRDGLIQCASVDEYIQRSDDVVERIGGFRQRIVQVDGVKAVVHAMALGLLEQKIHARLPGELDEQPTELLHADMVQPLRVRIDREARRLAGYRYGRQIADDYMRLLGQGDSQVLRWLEAEKDPRLTEIVTHLNQVVEGARIR